MALQGPHQVAWKSTKLLLAFWRSALNCSGVSASDISYFNFDKSVKLIQLILSHLYFPGQELTDISELPFFHPWKQLRSPFSTSSPLWVVFELEWMGILTKSSWKRQVISQSTAKWLQTANKNDCLSKNDKICSFNCFRSHYPYTIFSFKKGGQNNQ